MGTRDEGQYQNRLASVGVLFRGSRCTGAGGSPEKDQRRDAENAEERGEEFNED